eukprot:TRINITY_DN45095_c0_g1_i1.p1 TRINITY_DN45095_c0_g1~~TRINITY_DN45095_c0_g1_i1.p1  ORF type:complete len:339 (+),score=11.99 TRINITY_DN45095_c0_g1_i1:63-1079(+)
MRSAASERPVLRSIPSDRSFTRVVSAGSPGDHKIRHLETFLHGAALDYSWERRPVCPRTRTPHDQHEIAADIWRLRDRAMEICHECAHVRAAFLKDLDWHLSSDLKREMPEACLGIISGCLGDAASDVRFHAMAILFSTDREKLARIPIYRLQNVVAVLTESEMVVRLRAWAILQKLPEEVLGSLPCPTEEAIRGLRMGSVSGDVHDDLHVLARWKRAAGKHGSPTISEEGRHGNQTSERRGCLDGVVAMATGAGVALCRAASSWSLDICSSWQKGRQGALSPDATACVICMQKPREVMVEPCAHVCLCLSCADNNRGNLSGCPLCRKPVSTLRRIFL